MFKLLYWLGELESANPEKENRGQGRNRPESVGGGWGVHLNFVRKLKGLILRTLWVLEEALHNGSRKREANRIREEMDINLH